MVNTNIHIERTEVDVFPLASNEKLDEFMNLVDEVYKELGTFGIDSGSSRGTGTVCFKFGTLDDYSNGKLDYVPETTESMTKLNRWMKAFDDHLPWKDFGKYTRIVVDNNGLHPVF